jgi:hypothetical protein
LSHPRSKHTFMELSAHSLTALYSEHFFLAGCLTIGALLVPVAAVVAVVGGLDITGRAVLLAISALAVMYLARRALRLRRFARRGVEAHAVLVDVATEFGGETDFRIATYEYLYQGRPHRVQVVGADLQQSAATRYGQSAVVLVDPEHPDDAIVVRSLDP